MKIKDKQRNNHEKKKSKHGVGKQKLKKEKVLVVAQEIKYARLLSGNEKKTRDRVLKALKKWLSACFEKNYEFKEEDFIRVWKGLFYAVWMSDKPLVQEELCENISSILDAFPPSQLRSALLMTKAGFKVLATEWYGIDHHRIDKFLMLVRRYLRGSLRCLLRCDWSVTSCEMYADMMSGSDGVLAVKTPHYARNATSMLMHIMDCFLEEVSKISRGAIPGPSLAALLRPFIDQVASGSLAQRARRVLTELARYSEPQLQYEEKRKAWENMGCPAGGPDALELVSDDEQDPPGSEDEYEESVSLDPRAGRVHATVYPLSAPADLLADMLRDKLGGARAAHRTRLRICMDRFARLARSLPPLPLTTPPAPLPSPLPPKALSRAARDLHSLENKLKGDADELKLRGLSRKHRKRLLRKSRAGLSIVDELPANTHTEGEWQVDSVEDKQTDTSNKENQQKQKRKNTDTEKKIDKRRKIDNKIQDRQDKDKSYAKDSGKNKSVDKSKIKSSLSKKRSDDAIKDKVSAKNSLKIKDSGNDSLKVKDSSKDNSFKGKDSAIRKDILKDSISTKDKSKHDNLNTKDNLKKEKNNLNKEIILTNEKINKNTEKTNKNTEKTPKYEKKTEINEKKISKIDNGPKWTVNKVKKYQNNIKNLNIQEIKNQKIQDIKEESSHYETPKKVKFVLKNNSMQKPVDYYKSVRQSPSIPFDSSKKPVKTNLKPSTPSPINPFFKKILKMRK